MKKDLTYYLRLNYPYTIEEEDENGVTVYVAEIPDLPGCGAQGETLEETRKNLEQAKRLWIEESLKRNLSISEPSTEFSGRILLRISPKLHGQLNKTARQAGVSLNQFIRNLLEVRLDMSNIVALLGSMEQSIQKRFELIEQSIQKNNDGLAILQTQVQGLRMRFWPAYTKTLVATTGGPFKSETGIEVDISSSPEPAEPTPEKIVTA